MFEEKRISERIAAVAPMRYQLKGSQRFSNTMGRDISDRGIGFISNEFLPVSTHLVFEIQHPKTEAFIKAVGEVVWISDNPHSESFSIGARFIEGPIAI
ncbi:PilZ domain-containing protein [Candidatus Omnitrophota bacterium]